MEKRVLPLRAPLTYREVIRLMKAMMLAPTASL